MEKTDTNRFRKFFNKFNRFVRIFYFNSEFEPKLIHKDIFLRVFHAVSVKLEEGKMNDVPFKPMIGDQSNGILHLGKLDLKMNNKKTDNEKNDNGNSGDQKNQ